MSHREPRTGRTPAALTFLRWVALIVIILVALVRLVHVRMPLDRDEGEYAYTGQLMLRGIPPFQLASNMKFPGTAAAYAVTMSVFGETAAGIRVGLLIVNLATIAAIFFLARQLFGDEAGWAASAVYAELSVSAGVLGLAAYAEHFVLLPALLATLLLLRSRDSLSYRSAFSSGLLYGLAVLMKQPGIFFAIFGMLFLLILQRDDWRKSPAAAARRLLLLIVGGVLPVAAMCILLWRYGVFTNFWFWTVKYGIAYGSVVPLSKGFESFLSGAAIATQAAIPWLLGLAGLVMVWIRKSRREDALWVTAFLAFSFLAVCPGLYFREHYFIYLLPAVAILAGAAVKLYGEYIPLDKSALVFGMLIAISLTPQLARYASFNDKDLSRSIYSANPFPEAVPLADYIRSRTGSDARIAVIGSEPEIYFYAHRLSATDHIYMYPLVEPQPFVRQMQSELMSEIEAARPAYIVLVRVPSSWEFLDNATPIFDWFSEYSRKNYEVVGVADILSPKDTVYVWDTSAATYEPRSQFSLSVYKRKAPSS